jgi:phytoene synthase
MNRAPLAPVAVELRAAAPERFTCALFAPASAREALMALAAFEVATARATHATQVLAGLGRLAFWRDALAGAGDGRPLSHPVADALRAAIVAHRLPMAPFAAHLDARTAMLTDGSFATLDDLAAHACATHLPLLQLGARALGVAVPAGADAAAEVLGLVGLLREAIVLARAGRLALPAALATAAGFGVQSIAEGRNREAVASVVAAVADHARMSVARIGRPPRPAWPVLLPLVPARAVLAALQRAEHDPAAAAAWQIGTATRLMLLWAAIAGPAGRAIPA